LSLRVRQWPCSIDKSIDQLGDADLPNRFATNEQPDTAMSLRAVPFRLPRSIRTGMEQGGLRLTAAWTGKLTHDGSGLVWWHPIHATALSASNSGVLDRSVASLGFERCFQGEEPMPYERLETQVCQLAGRPDVKRVVDSVSDKAADLTDTVAEH
jgi:hypothetical protein